MFLKIGAAVFCVIHIIHIFLIIVKEVNSSLIDSKIQKSFFFDMTLHVIYEYSLFSRQ